MIVKKMKYIFLLIFTLQNYNFCCEECCNYWEDCWNNCWDNSTTDQDFFLQGENIINNKIPLWKDKNTTKFETTDVKYGVCEHDNFYSGNTFAYYEQFYIPTKEEIDEKRKTTFSQNIYNYQNIVDFKYKNDDYCVIVENIAPVCKGNNNENNNTSTLVYYVSVFLIYKKNEQNVYKLESDKAFFVFNIDKKKYFLSEDWNKYMKSWDRKIKEKIKNNLQNLEKIQSNITDLGAIIEIDFNKKNVSNIIYNNEVENIIDKNFDLDNIDPNDRSWYRKGLANIGATCYMNATLQCFAHIPEFVTFFRQNQQVQDVIKKNQDEGQNNLTCAFAELLQNLYPTNLDNRKDKTYYEPNNFKNTISQMNPLFEGIAANDAKDLVNFLIMTLHEELNNAPQNNNDNFLPDQTNKQLMLQNFSENFVKTYNSTISDLFYALNYNITQCSNCNIKSYNYQIYFFLNFPLEEVRKYKLNNNNNGAFNFNQNINEVNIKDCFNFENKVNTMSGDNAMYCNYCKQTCTSYMRTILATGPEILIIVLNRGKGIQFNVKLNFSEELNLSDYIEIQNTGTQYDLFGVITHIGESGMGGHFIAYCKDLWDNNPWYKYNDAIVSPVTNFKSEVVDFAMPYVLFYKKKDNNMFKNNNNHNVISQINNMLQNNNMMQNNNNMMNFQNNNNNMFFPFNNMNPQINNMFFQFNNMIPNNNMNYQN